MLCCVCIRELAMIDDALMAEGKKSVWGCRLASQCFLNSCKSKGNSKCTKINHYVCPFDNNTFETFMGHGVVELYLGSFARVPTNRVHD